MSTIEELKEKNAQLKKQLEDTKNLPTQEEITEEILSLLEENAQLELDIAEAVISKG